MLRQMLLGLTLLFGSYSVLTADDAKPVAELQGKWKLTAVEVDDRQAELPDDLPVWEIKGNKVLYGQEELATLVIDGGVTPKTIDLQFVSPDKTYEGIFAVKEDTLSICVNNVTDGVKQRPAELTTKDQPSFRLLTFKRAAADETGPMRGFVGLALKVDDATSEIVVASIVPDSPAKKADLKEGDVLLEVAGVKASKLLGTVEAIRKIKPGSELAISLRRGDREKEITVKADLFPFRLSGILD